MQISIYLLSVYLSIYLSIDLSICVCVCVYIYILWPCPPMLGLRDKVLPEVYSVLTKPLCC